MFATKPLSSFKNALPSIHQPLPLSSRESQKLLRALKTSFRQNLDKEHGWGLEDAESSAAQTTSKKHSRHDSHRRPTDTHLRSILSNPLFKSSAKLNDTAFKAPRDPMDVFDEAVSKGMMTRRAATGCLRAKRRQILDSGAISTGDSMSISMSGSRVLQWLRSSGQERTLEFLADSPFVSSLTPFLVAEGLEEVVWEWAERAVRSGEGENRMARHLIYHLVLSESSFEDKNLDSAFAMILRALETWKSSPQLPVILFSPWRALSYKSTITAWQRPLPSAPLFESFVNAATHLNKPLGLDIAHLNLHHPTHPNHMRAMSYLNRFTGMGEKQRGSCILGTDTWNPLIVRVMVMGMDAVSHLTRLGKTGEAAELMDLLQSKLPEKLWRKHTLEASRMALS